MAKQINLISNGHLSKTLSFEQTKALVSAVHSIRKPSTQDEALIIALLLCGSQARTWAWEEQLADVLHLPAAVYKVLRALAISKRLMIIPFNHARFAKMHWVNGACATRAIFTASHMHGKALTTHEVTRKLKRYARIAGLDPVDVSLRTMQNTHKALINLYGNAEQLSDALGIENWNQSEGTVRWGKVDQDHRLHGIGRRRSLAVA